MNFSDAQRDMRQAFYGGASGLVSSALVWGIAGLVALTRPPQHAVWTLFIGGTMIFPASVLLAKLLGRSGAATPGNPLTPLALAGTFWMLLCFPLAFIVAFFRVDWFFAVTLLIIGGRYLTFATVYGNKVYWACGFMLAAAGFASLVLGVSFAAGAFAGAALEAAFAVVIFAQERKSVATA
jgi:hypothetical protein